MRRIQDVTLWGTRGNVANDVLFDETVILCHVSKILRREIPQASVPAIADGVRGTNKEIQGTRATKLVFGYSD